MEPAANLADALAETGLASIQDLIDMAKVGSSLMDTIAVVTQAEGPFKHWTPAEDPAEIVIDLINHYEDAPQAWRPEVRAFADLMERQLRANDHKPGWDHDVAEDLLLRLRQETQELAEAIAPGSRTTTKAWRQQVGTEAADVANFAMMIADVCGALQATGGEDVR